MSKKTEARCSGTMLTVGFHTATPPLVWRFDLERNHSFTLSLQGDEGDWELCITSPKGDFYPVVHFAAREDAEEALEKVEKALARKKGSCSLLTKALGFLGVLAVLVVIGVILYGISANNALKQMSSSLTGSTSSPTVEQGVPLSADDVLQPPH